MCVILTITIIFQTEVMIHIFNYLDLKSLSCCARVSRRWNEVAGDAFLYQNLSLKVSHYICVKKKICSHAYSLDIISDKFSQ